MSEDTPDQPAGNGAAPRAPTLTDQLDTMLFPMFNCLTRGASASLANIPPQVMLMAICRQMGRIVGMSFGMGDLGPILKMRAECKKAFDDGVNSIKPQPMPAQPQAPMTAVPR